ncbi:MAG: hypothetical protein Q4B81_00125 [Moraxella sp.]|nr:hypothetical protein [Moraxella sp.]
MNGEESTIFHPALKQMQVIDSVSVNQKADSFDEVRKMAVSLIDKPILNEKLGFVATVSKNSLNKMLSGKAHVKSANLKTHLTAIVNRYLKNQF